MISIYIAYYYNKYINYVHVNSYLQRKKGVRSLFELQSLRVNAPSEYLYTNITLNHTLTSSHLLWQTPSPLKKIKLRMSYYVKSVLNIPEQGCFCFIVHWSISPLTHSKITTYMHIPEVSSAERVLPAQVLIWRWILIEPIHFLNGKYLAAYKNRVRKIYQLSIKHIACINIHLMTTKNLKCKRKFVTFYF